MNFWQDNSERRLIGRTTKEDRMKAKEDRMKAKSLSIVILIGLLAAGLAAQAEAQSFFELAGAEEKYEPGDFRPAPETMHTRFGTLDFPGGYPTEATSRKVFDELDLQRATMLYLDMYPALSAHGLMKGWIRDLGMRDSSHISVTANRLDSSALVLTGNTESLYAFAVFDLKKDGPTVFEVPPGVMGPLDDHRFLFVADIGPTGMDKGQGGKYLLLPPGYDGDIPGKACFCQRENRPPACYLECFWTRSVQSYDAAA